MSLKIWLPLTGSLINQGLDNSSVTNNGVTVDDDGKIGKCYNFANGYLNLPVETMTSFTECSLCFWIRINAWNASYETYFQAGKNNSAWGDYIFGVLRNGTSSKICFTIGNGSTASNASYLTSDWVVGQWMHVAFVYSANTCKIYLNGELDKEYSTTLIPNFSKITKITVGHSNGSSYQTNCKMNDLRIYDNALSSLEIKHISQGLVLHYPLNRSGFGQENLLANSQLGNSWTYPASSYSDKYSPTTTSIPSKSVYTLSFDAKSTVNGDKIRTHYYSPNTTTTCVSSQGVTKTASDGSMDFTLSTDWKKYWVIYNQNETTANKHVICPRLMSGEGTGTISVKNVKLEAGDKPTQWSPALTDSLAIAMGLHDFTEYDCSGFGNNGNYYSYDTYGSVEYDSNSPKYSVCTYINSDKNTVNNASGTVYLYGLCNLHTPQQMTFTFWCKPIGGYGNSVGQGQFCTTNYEFGNSNVGADYLQSAMNHRDSAVDINDSTGSSHLHLNVNFISEEWHHYAVTYDGKNAKSYKDGVLQDTKSFSDNKALGSISGVIVGFSKAGGVWRSNKSYYSDVRLYTTALSNNEIIELYKTPVSIANNGALFTSGELMEG